MKKFKDFLLSHLNKIIPGLIIFIMLVHFFINFKLVQDTKLIGESWINLINGYILNITMSVGLIFLIWLSFLVHKETAKDLEKFLLKNLTTACFLLIMLLGFHGILGNLEKNFALTAIGAIIVFWYGYKTYERDKEIQMIEQYSEKYNVIKDKIAQSVKPTNKDYTELLTLWYEEYFLFDKGYISSELWNEWEYWIKRDIACFLREGEKIFASKVTSDIEDSAMWVYCMDSCIFLDLICQDYIPNPKKQEEFRYKDKFSRYLVSLIKLEENKISEYRDTKWKYGLNELITILTKTEI